MLTVVHQDLILNISTPKHRRIPRPETSRRGCSTPATYAWPWLAICPAGCSALRPTLTGPRALPIRIILLPTSGHRLKLSSSSAAGDGGRLNSILSLWTDDRPPACLPACLPACPLRWRDVILSRRGEKRRAKIAQ